MFGQCFPGDPPFGCADFDPGAGVDGVGVVGVVVVAVVDVDVVAAVLVELGAAAAPAMPETAPPAGKSAGHHRRAKQLGCIHADRTSW